MRRWPKSPTPPQPEPGLTSEDVEEAVRKALADMPEPDSGLSKREVGELVSAAIAAISKPQPGLTPAEAERIARGRRGVHPAQVGPRRVHQVLRRQRNQSLRDPGPGSYPRLLQPGGERRRPVVRVHHRRERPCHRAPRRPPNGLDLKGWGEP